MPMDYMPHNDRAKNEIDTTPEKPLNEQASVKAAGQAVLEAVNTEQQRLAAQGNPASLGLPDLYINIKSAADPMLPVTETISPVGIGDEIPKTAVRAGEFSPSIPFSKENSHFKWRGPDGLPPITGHSEIPRMQTRQGEFQ